MEYDNGDIYKGEFKNDKRERKCKIIMEIFMKENLKIMK